MEIEIHEKQTNAEVFENLPDGTIFDFDGSIMMKIYNCEANAEFGLVMDPMMFVIWKLMKFNLQRLFIIFM